MEQHRPTYTGDREPQTEQLWQLEAPRISEMNLEGRVAVVESKTAIATNEPTRLFTEAEGIENLVAFLDHAISVATEKGNEQMLKLAQAFKENCRFVGEQEFTYAAEVIAEYIYGKVLERKTVYLAMMNNRSEKYTTLRILEAFDRLTEGSPELRQFVKVSYRFGKNDPAALDPENSHIIVPDDFVISGTRISSTVLVIQRLEEAGISKEQAQDMCEAYVVALPVDTASQEKLIAVNHEGYNLRGVYGVPKYHNPNGGLYVTGGVSISGTHCSVDYGFENPLERLGSFLEQNDEGAEPALLTNIVRPYTAAVTEDGVYRDIYTEAAMRDRWTAIVGQYGLEHYKSTYARELETFLQDTSKRLV